MTTTVDAPDLPVPVVCDPGQDFTDLVTVKEIGIVARQLGCNPIVEIEQGGPKSFDAMARLGWVLHRRTDPQAKPDAWDGLTLPQLLAALGVPMGETQDQVEARRVAEAQADAANPTDGAPA